MRWSDDIPRLRDIEREVYPSINRLIAESKRRVPEWEFETRRVLRMSHVARIVLAKHKNRNMTGKVRKKPPYGESVERVERLLQLAGAR